MGVSAGSRKSFPVCWMPCPSPLPVSYPHSWSSHRVSPLSCCGWGLHQSSAEPCREWQARQVPSSLIAGGGCVPAAAFGSGPGGCALGWDSSWLLGACLLPLALLPVCMGLFHAGFFRALASLPPVRASCAHSVRSRRCGLSLWCTDLLSVPSSAFAPARAPTLLLLGLCVGVHASWRNN